MQKMQETYLKTIAESSVDVTKRRCPTVKSCPFLLYFHFGTFRNFKHYYLFFIKGTMVGVMALNSTLRAMTEAR